MVKNFLLFFLLIFLVINSSYSALDPGSGFGGTTPGCKGIVCCTSTPCSWADLVRSFSNLIKTAVWFAYLVALLMCVIGAFFLMLHGPFPHLYSQGKNLIYTAIVGYVLILAAGIIFDIVLEFFGPIKLRETTLNLNIAFAEVTSDDEVFTYYNFIKEGLMSALKCGQGATSALDRLFRCLFEVIDFLKNFALILLGAAIIASALYLITTPLFGLKNIPRAWQILKWSIIGFIIILLSDIIRAQIERIVK